MFVAQRTSSNQLSLHISDVIDIIGQDDPDYAASAISVYGGVQMGGGGGGGGAASEANFSTISSASRPDPDLESKRKAYVRIIEQPQAKALRFRYICEGRSAGSIPGVRSTTENKTYPAIQVVGYKGPAVVVVSCVTVDPPYRPHPHNLVGKEGCKKGVCTMTINNDSMQCVFSNLGIQCVKKRDVEDALKLREEIRVDPFQTGFSHRNQPQSIDLNALRLCFQVFLEGSEKGKFTFPLKPQVSDPIYDKKATSDLIICKLSDCTSSVAGGKEIILLCDKVTKEDIHVRFYEVKDGMIEWEAFGDFQASDVHKQVAISFKTPRYKTLEIENPIKVYVQLLRPPDKSTSEPRPFQYLPLDSDPQYLKRKMAKLGNSANTEKISRYLAENMAGTGKFWIFSDM
uniref:Dorsal n=1 Tax=Penaeus vannamei TaxID=6689 RepID=D2E9Y3_PENVA|nr:dorsal [Penaeus vannamei]